MKKDILIVAQYTQAPGEHENDRFKYLAQMLIKKPDVDVEIVTMDFSHHNKRHRDISENQACEFGYKMSFVHVTGYKKNVSIKRVISNHIMGKNLRKYLNKRKKPDVVYVAIPSLDAGKAAADYCKDNNIKMIIDIQDIWPEAFKLALNIPVVSDIVFYPMKRKAEYIYLQADGIISVSDTYVNRALEVNHKDIPTKTVFLGTELSAFDKIEPVSKKESDCITIVYVGTLGASYDLISTIEAMAILKEKNKVPINFLVMGDGPDKEKFIEHARKLDIRCEFTGRLPYSEMVARLKSCDIAVNPIHENAPQSIINKHADYAAAGLPVVNTQQCKEYIELLKEYNAGINCKDSSKEEISKAIDALIHDKQLRETMSNGSRKLAEEKFDRCNTYIHIVNEILNI